MRRNKAMTIKSVLSSKDPGPDRAVVSPKRPIEAPTITVMIPTLNEAGNLPYVLNTIPSWVDEVLIVDGRSQDDTLRIARVLRPDVRVIHETRPGKGAAMKAGFDAAKGDFIIALDADGSMDGAQIGAFRDAFVNGADYEGNSVRTRWWLGRYHQVPALR
jgi:glycosyltransferase involved in cell wall biosynthesis